jgi:hypothetical protein
VATAQHLNHPGVLTPPAVPASTVTATNGFGCPCLVQIKGGTVTAVTVAGVALSIAGSLAFVPDGATIALTYAVAPTWTWYGLA